MAQKSGLNLQCINNAKLDSDFVSNFMTVDITKINHLSNSVKSVEISKNLRKIMFKSWSQRNDSKVEVQFTMYI